MSPCFFDIFEKRMIIDIMIPPMFDESKTDYFTVMLRVLANFPYSK